MPRRFRVRDLVGALLRHGCRPLRTRGSHQRWATPNGATFGLVVNHPGSDVSNTILASVRRTLRAEGIELASTSGTGGAA